MTDDKAKQTPLIEQLDAVPFRARLAIDDPDGMEASYIPVGRYCHEAAAELRRLDALNAELVEALKQIMESATSYKEDAWCKAIAEEALAKAKEQT